MLKKELFKWLYRLSAYFHVTLDDNFICLGNTSIATGDYRVLACWSWPWADAGTFLTMFGICILQYLTTQYGDNKGYVSMCRCVFHRSVCLHVRRGCVSTCVWHVSAEKMYVYIGVGDHVGICRSYVYIWKNACVPVVVMCVCFFSFLHSQIHFTRTFGKTWDKTSFKNKNNQVICNIILFFEHPRCFDYATYGSRRLYIVYIARSIRGAISTQASMWSTTGGGWHW